MVNILVKVTRKLDTKYGWRAIYPDGTVLEQFPSSSKETNFHEVETKGMPELFYVGSGYGVDLRNGAFMFGDKVMRIGDLDANPYTPIGLVYFRRNQIDFTLASNIKRQQVWHFLGFKFSGGQVMLCVPGDGGIPTICFKGV